MTSLVTPIDCPSNFVVPAFIETLRQQSFYYHKLAAQLKQTKQPNKTEFDLHRQYHKAAVKMYAEWIKYREGK